MMTDNAKASMTELSVDMLDDVAGGSVVGLAGEVLDTIGSAVIGIGEVARGIESGLYIIVSGERASATSDRTL
ncbi:hypothetical protein HQN64_06880 [Enterobacteriaceae bacterium BIT-l23]|uniref:hypothetical protein n=1 Tax=Jejubacter sp. L23 TaxID=3092086 RepID=UPI0015857632|nr:hypothetical protein [Enterobacteriaceae bacterium BIT-l23]